MLSSCIVLPVLALCMQVSGNQDAPSAFFQSWDINNVDEDIAVMNLLEENKRATWVEDKTLGLVARKRPHITSILQPCETATIQGSENTPFGLREYKVGDQRSQLTITCDLSEDKQYQTKLIVTDGLDSKMASQGRLQFTSQTGLLKVSMTGSKNENVDCTVKASFTSSCGMVNRAGRILDGEVTEVNEYPWQVGLVRANDLSDVFCGGSIINSCYIVTSALCRVDPENVKVLVDGHNRTATESNTYVNVDSVITYDGLGMLTLIAVLKLSEPLPLSNTVMPICLPSDTSLAYVDSNATITGWGATTKDGLDSDVLTEAQVNVISNEECRQLGGAAALILSEDMMCTGTPPGICPGDPGGPLSLEEDGRSVLIGISTFIGRCSSNGDDPDIYTRVTSYLDWLKNITSDCDGCALPGQ